MKHIKHNQSGIAAMEFALILPVLLALLLGVLEFGVYFTKSSVVSRGVSSISAAIQMSPTATNLQTDAQNSGFGMVSYTGQNYFCALAYSTRDAAANYCAAGQWSTVTPVGHTAGAPYYVAIVAFVKNTPISGLTAFLPDIAVRNIIQVGGAANDQAHGAFRAGHVNQNKNAGTVSWASLAGSWTVPEGVTNVKATLVAGGQGGFGGNLPAGLRGSGGSSGGVMVAYLSGLTPGDQLSYVVGGGGMGATSSTGHGMAGSATIFNGLSVSGGSLLSSTAFGTAPTEGSLVSVVTYYSVNGKTFENFQYNAGSSYVGGHGGDTPLGFGVGGSKSPNDSSGAIFANGQGYGSGGAGQTRNTVSGYDISGSGAPGLLLIEW